MIRVCMYLCCVSENVSANYDRDRLRKKHSLIFTYNTGCKTALILSCLQNQKFYRRGFEGGDGD